MIDLTAIGGGLGLTSDAAVDLHLHTYASDGGWAPRQLVDYLVEHEFRVAAICDHDTQRSVAEAIDCGRERGLTVIPGVEVTTGWRDRRVDLLVYGIHPDSIDPDAADFLALMREIDEELIALADDARTRIEAKHGAIPYADELRVDRPLWPYHVLMGAIKAGYVKNLTEAAKLTVDLGGRFTTDRPLARVVTAAHRAGGICLIAHPGREYEGGNITAVDIDAILGESPIDGIEAHYRSYSDAKTAELRAIAAERGLLVSCGSDSHAPGQPVDPRPWRAAWCADFLHRFGIYVADPTGDPWSEGMDPQAASPQPEPVTANV